MASRRALVQHDPQPNDETQPAANGRGSIQADRSKLAGCAFG